MEHGGRGCDHERVDGNGDSGKCSDAVEGSGAGRGGGWSSHPAVRVRGGRVGEISPGASDDDGGIRASGG